MKKSIARVLCLINLVACGWLIVSKLKFLDIASNKNEWYAMRLKRKIKAKTDIDDCEKRLQISVIDGNRANAKHISALAFETQIFALGVMIIQIVLLIFISLMPRKKNIT